MFLKKKPHKKPETVLGFRQTNGYQLNRNMKTDSSQIGSPADLFLCFHLSRTNELKQIVIIKDLGASLLPSQVRGYFCC